MAYRTDADILTPLGDKMIVHIQERSQVEADAIKKRSGIIMAIPEQEGKPNRGKVLRIGPGVQTIKANDEIIFGIEKTLGNAFIWKGRKVFIVKESEVQAILND